jgi:mono/diheme cytochrome c family protein
VTQWRLPLGLGALTLGVVGAAVTWAGGGARSDEVGLDAATVFQLRGCATCHDGPDSTSMTGAGPPLVDAAAWAGERRPGLTSEAYLAESMRSPGVFRSPVAHPGVEMPNLGLTDDEVDALVTYLLDG